MNKPLLLAFFLLNGSLIFAENNHSQCTGTHPEKGTITLNFKSPPFVFEELNGNIPLEIGASVDVFYQNDSETFGTYTLTRVISRNFSFYNYDLGFNGGYSHGTIQLVKDFPSQSLFLTFYKEREQLSIPLQCS